jgi:RimJ/RimL family protein N-acetyltransferase
MLQSEKLRNIRIEPTTLFGDRIRLEPLTLEHHSRMCEIGLDPRLWERTTIRVQTPEEMRQYIELALRWQAEGTGLPFAMIDKSSGRLIGSTRFHHASPENRRVEIGFTWIEPQWQGKRINYEAKYLMLRHAFEVWHCERVEFRADSENEPSRRALQNIGAKEEAVLRRAVLSVHGGPRDLVVYGIVASEWPSVKEGLSRKLAGELP